MHARVTRMIASVGSTIVRVGDVLDANVAGAVHDGCRASGVHPSALPLVDPE